MHVLQHGRARELLVLTAAVVPRRVCRRAVSAMVRVDGALGVFKRRRFDLMLGVDQSPEAEHREALRIIRQIGWEPLRIESIGEA